MRENSPWPRPGDAFVRCWKLEGCGRGEDEPLDALERTGGALGARRRLRELELLPSSDSVS